jgi:HAD superfamily hydrolase (TIGR01457 family)
MMKSRLSQLDLPPLGVILDMDGVLWRENAPIGNLPEIFSQLKAREVGVILATNNATKTISQYLSKLKGFGVDLEPWQVVTSSIAVTELLKKQFPDRGDVFIIGGDGLRESLEEAGFEIVPVGDTENAVAVIASIDHEVNFQKLKAGALLIRQGLPFYGTNPDLTFPTPEGLIPGAGSFLALLQAATGVTPIVAGKPAPDFMEFALKRLGTPREQTVVVGDRLETDIAGGQKIGCPTALVLSGVSTREMGMAWEPKVDFIAGDLTALLE